MRKLPPDQARAHSDFRCATRKLMAMFTEHGMHDISAGLEDRMLIIQDRVKELMEVLKP